MERGKLVKGNLKFIVFILLLIPGMFYFEQSFTKEFSWDASFNKNDKQPVCATC